MIKIYITIIILGILAGVGAGVKYYYDSTQATIATLRDRYTRILNAGEAIKEIEIHSM